MHIKLASMGLLILFSAQLWASPWSELPQVGDGKYSRLWFTVYHASLYTRSGEYDNSFPMAFQIEPHMSIKLNQLLDITDEELKRMGKKQEQRQRWLNQLSVIWSDVRADEKLTLFVDQSKASAFFKNEVLLGKIMDPEFAQAFLDIWLSPNTRLKQLREKLLGL